MNMQVMDIQDFARYGCQLAKKEPGPQPREATTSELVEHWIVFDELTGDACGGVVDHIRTRLREILVKCRDMGPQLLNPLGDAVTGELLKWVDDVHVGGFYRHAVSAYRPADGGACYLGNSGEGCLRHGAPPDQDNNTLYDEAYGIVRFGNVSDAAFATYLDISCKVHGASEFYSTAVAVLACNDVDPRLDKLGQYQNTHGLASMPGAKGIAHPMQENGSCSLKALLLGLFAAFLHACDPECENIGAAERCWWEWMYALFLKHARQHLVANAPSIDEIAAVSLRMYKLKAHWRAKAQGSMASTALLDEAEARLVAALESARRVEPRDPPTRRRISSVLNDELVRASTTCARHCVVGRVVQVTPDFVALADVYELPDLQAFLRDYAREEVRNLVVAKFPYMAYIWVREFVKKPQKLTRSMLADFRTVIDSWLSLAEIRASDLLNATTCIGRDDQYSYRGRSDGDLASVLMYIGLSHAIRNFTDRESTRTSSSPPGVFLHTNCWAESSEVYGFIVKHLRLCECNDQLASVTAFLKKCTVMLNSEAESLPMPKDTLLTGFAAGSKQVYEVLPHRQAAKLLLCTLRKTFTSSQYLKVVYNPHSKLIQLADPSNSTETVSWRKGLNDALVFLDCLATNTFDFACLQDSCAPFLVSMGCCGTTGLSTMVAVSPDADEMQAMQHAPVAALRSIIQHKYLTQERFESTLRSYMRHAAAKPLSRMVKMRIVHATAYLWIIMEYDNAANMSEIFSSPELLPLMEWTRHADDLGARDPHVTEAASALFAHVGYGRYNTLLSNAGGRAKFVQLLTCYRMFLMPFMAQDVFEEFVTESLADHVMSASNPLVGFAHVLFGRHVREKFRLYADHRRPESATVQFEPLSVPSLQEAAMEESIVKVHRNSVLPLVTPFARPANTRFDAILGDDGTLLCKDHPLIPGCFMDTFQWTRRAGDIWEGTALPATRSATYAYQLRVENEVVYKCDAVGRKLPAPNALMELRAAMRRGGELSALLERLSKVVDSDADIAVWGANDTGLIDIELLKTGSTFKLSDDAVLLDTGGSVYTVCVSGSHWSSDMPNCFTLTKQSTDVYFVAVFEQLKLPQSRSYRLRGIFNRPHAHDVSGAALRSVCHVIRVHSSGLCLIPSTYDAIWAYVQSTIQCRCPLQRHETMPLLKAMEDATPPKLRKALGKMSCGTCNWPLHIDTPLPMCTPIKPSVAVLCPFYWSDYDLDEYSYSLDRANVSLDACSDTDIISQLLQARDLKPEARIFIRNNLNRNLIQQARGGAGKSTNFMWELHCLMNKKVRLKQEEGVDTPLPDDHACWIDGKHPLLPPVVRLAHTDEGQRVLNGYVPVPKGAKKRRIAELVFFFATTMYPRDDQIKMHHTIMQDMRGTESTIRHMQMGSGKTAMVTPLCVIQTFFENVAVGRGGHAHALALVLPPPLVTQSALLLARDVCAYTAIPFKVHREAEQDFARGQVCVAEDTVVKQMIINRAGSGTSKPVYYLFDEVDTLCNPLTSELNIPRYCKLDTSVAPFSYSESGRRERDAAQKAEPERVCEAILPPTELFRKIMHATVSNTELKLEGYPSVQKEYEAMCTCARSLVHRKDFGLATHQEFEAHDAHIAHTAIPFTYGDTPAIGSKYSNLVLAMILTAISYNDLSVPLDMSYMRYLLDCLKEEHAADCISIFGKPREDIADCDLWSQRSNIRVREILAGCIAHEFQLEVVVANVTGVEMVMSCNAKHRAAFTGTPEPLPVHEYEKVHKKISFSAPPAGTLPAGVLPDIFVYEGTFLEQIPALVRGYNGLRVILDGGCALMHDTLEEVHARLCPRQDLLHWDKDTHAPTLRGPEGVLDPWGGDDDTAMGVFYRHVNTTGIDARLSAAVGVITVDSHMRYRDFMQTVYRLRKIEHGDVHTCVVAMTKSTFANVEGEDGATHKDKLLNWLQKNSAARLQQQIDLAHGQCVRAVLRGDATVLQKHNQDAFLCIRGSVLVPDARAHSAWWVAGLLRCAEKNRIINRLLRNTTMRELAERVLQSMDGGVCVTSLVQHREQEYVQVRITNVDQYGTPPTILWKDIGSYATGACSQISCEMRYLGCPFTKKSLALYLNVCSQNTDCLFLLRWSSKKRNRQGRDLSSTVVLSGDEVAHVLLAHLAHQNAPKGLGILSFYPGNDALLWAPDSDQTELSHICREARRERHLIAAKLRGE